MSGPEADSSHSIEVTPALPVTPPPVGAADGGDGEPVEPTGEVPVVGDTRAVGLLKDMVERLRDTLRGSFKELDGREVARFVWKKRLVDEGGEVTVLIENMPQRGGKAMPQFKLRFRSRGAELESDPLQIWLSATAAGYLRAQVSFSRKLFHVDLVHASEIESGAPLSTGVNLYAQQVEDAADLGYFWFSKQGRRDDEYRQFTVVQRPSVEPVGTYWPVFSDDQYVLPRPSDVQAIDQWALTTIAFCVWAVLLWLHQTGERTPCVPQQERMRAFLFAPGALPEPSFYPPKSTRPVELEAHRVMERLRARNLEVPWQVVEAACTSLNTGKHVLFTGPPGCGKTELAVELANQVCGARHDTRRALVVTASPAWTYGDVIGRYFPRRDGQGLEFRPGVFLRALREGRPLLIDEFNRAPMDECFGELFTVLAGHSVELPFRDEAPDGSSGEVRILVERDAEGAGPLDYTVPSAFRLLGTMNDADRAELKRLSYALLRRIDIIRVEAPPPATVEAIVRKAIANQNKKARLDEYGYEFRAGRRRLDAVGQIEVAIGRFVVPLFARSRSQAGPGFRDLVSEGVIGMASVIDVVRFLAEGLRSSSNARACAVSDAEAAQSAIASILAMALVLKVFPQFDSLEPSRLREAVAFLLGRFRNKDGVDIPFSRIQPVDDDEAETEFRVVVEQTGLPIDLNSDGLMSINEFLVDELCRQFRGTGLEAELRAMATPQGPASA